MNAKEAQEILMLYRPGTADAEDPEIIEAMAVARSDARLARWFENHCAFQRAMRAKLREIEVPPHLKLALRTRVKTARLPAWWLGPAWVAPAAALVLVLAGTAIWLNKPVTSNRLANFQSRMVGTALRDYRMDIRSSDMSRLREYLAANGAPADYDVTAGLQRLPLTGGGVLRWQNHPVSMVCFDAGQKQMLFLFVLERAALKDPPPETPQVSRHHNALAASWSRGGKTYLLAGPEEPGFPQKYY